MSAPVQWAKQKRPTFPVDRLCFDYYSSPVAHSPLSQNPYTCIMSNWRCMPIATTIQQAFGSCVRQFRTETGLSQEKFALKINMDRTYFASVESGRRNISLENIKKIADGLNVPISELFQSIERNDKD